ncbi:uncharacterized protein A1O9_02003 [Exophiala aquamarina CBS 119918]|uniref:DUF7029 domain-containing protein n=1 Tax=Exophiala aquamarina CBS 119918 TaxID=1182545 RepID=A0A072PL17_9EURO|nr:uncharacterized protein A1O9_02003 [Exophiala aquamarina CBS 119918]KEF60442.1 hypothetical protein A1O9_02003 [Exophiala aquamarina CBS 119918]
MDYALLVCPVSWSSRARLCNNEDRYIKTSPSPPFDTPGIGSQFIVAMLNLNHMLSLHFLSLVTTVHALVFDNPALLAASSRQLYAAVTRSDTQRRADVLTPVHGASLTYSDGASDSRDGTSFSSTVSFQSRNPLVVLEHIENLIADVHCTSTSITISFNDLRDSYSACESWSDLVQGHLIVSQEGCVREGSRAPFKVLSMTCTRMQPIISLSVSQVKWHDAFHGFRVSFGRITEPLELYSHQRPMHEKRQESATTTAADPLASSLIPSGPVATATAVSIDLSHEGDGGNWFPELKTSALQLPIDIDCKDCLTKGSLELSQGEWELLDAADWLDAGSFTDIFKVGFVRFNLKDFFAHVELQVTPSIEGSESFVFFSLTVPGVTGFTLPEIGKAGLLLEPQLSLSWKLSGAVELTYGFELEIPNLDILINFSDPGSSQVTGLDDIGLSDLPFQANLGDIELSVEVSLQPRVTLGVEFLEVLTAESGLFIDLPKTTLVLTQIATDTFDANCEPMATTDSDTDKENLLQDIFQNLTHITTGYEVGIGLDLRAGTNFDLGSLGVKNIELTSSLPLVATQLDRLAATQCLVFQPDATGGPAFAKATEALADAQSSMAAASASSSSAQAVASASAAASEGSSDKENAAHGTYISALGSSLRRVGFYGVVFIGNLYLSL